MAIGIDLAQAQESLSLSVGHDRIHTALLLARLLLERLALAGISHEEAADVVRTIIAALEGRP